MKAYFIACFISCVFFSQSGFAGEGILLLAHGTMAMEEPENRCKNLHPSSWEKAILDSVERIESNINEPMEVAFGMWNSSCYEFSIQKLKLRLEAKGETLDHLRVLPIFISSHSLVIDMQKYIFKLREDKVIDIPNVNQISFAGKISYLKAMDYDPYISTVVVGLAHELVAVAESKEHRSDQLDLILVMHGPVDAEANLKWLDMGETYAKDIRQATALESTHVISLQDDAEKETREANTKQLRDLVESATKAGRQTLILPLLLSKGGIQGGIIHRLKGLSYLWTGQALFSDLKIDSYLMSRLQRTCGVLLK